MTFGFLHLKNRSNLKKEYRLKIYQSHSQTDQLNISNLSTCIWNRPDQSEAQTHQKVIQPDDII